MTFNSGLQISLFLLVLFGAAKPLGRYMADVYVGRGVLSRRVISPLERALYRLTGVDPQEEMTWQEYAAAVLWLSLVSVLVVYGVQRLQDCLPLNAEQLAGVSPDSSFNTAVSFVTNTNWQSYSGESTMSTLTQMAALTVQNFVSAAVGMAVLAALIRGFTRSESATIGNFWVDLVRGLVGILLPLSLVLAMALVSQGVVQTLQSGYDVELLEPRSGPDGERIAVQHIAVGPVASQVAIKQLGTNGGGYFNANSAHPLENPTPFSGFLQLLSILLIPCALCHTLGTLVGDPRQGRAILAAMGAMVIPLMIVVVVAEQAGNPVLSELGIRDVPSDATPGGNMEGKETRFGITASALWAVATTAASSGSVNAMHDSFTPLGGLIPMWLIQLGEVVFGGVGSGLYGMLIFVMLTVFLAGLMVGRTPEYLGKKIGGFEIRMAVLAILVPCAGVLLGTATAVALPAGRESVFNPGPHGFSEVLYAFSSAANNNGSAFAGLAANTPFYNGLLGLMMLAGRFWVMLPVLAIAGSLAARKSVPAGPGTLPTHTLLFTALLVCVVTVVGALSYLPALALGPVAEHLELQSVHQEPLQ